MKRILLLGASGHLGSVLLSHFLKKHYLVTALVRNPEKITLKHENLTVIQGTVTDKNDLSKALSGIDIVISALGHGFRTGFPIQEKTLQNLIPLMKEKKIKRIVTITGSGLRVKGDPPSLILTLSDIFLPLIDPPRLQDARAQQNLLEKSNLDWTVVRTPIHNGSNSAKIHHVGLGQPPFWKTISRPAIAAFMEECIEKNLWINGSPIIY